jgi:hypothetical protein
VCGGVGEEDGVYWWVRVHCTVQCVWTMDVLALGVDVEGQGSIFITLHSEQSICYVNTFPKSYHTTKNT